MNEKYNKYWIVSDGEIIPVDSHWNGGMKILELKESKDEIFKKMFEKRYVRIATWYSLYIEIGNKITHKQFKIIKDFVGLYSIDRVFVNKRNIKNVSEIINELV